MVPHVNDGSSHKKDHRTSQPHQPTLQEQVKREYETYINSISGLTHMALNQIVIDIHPLVSEIDNAALATKWSLWILDLGNTCNHRNEFIWVVVVY